MLNGIQARIKKQPWRYAKSYHNLAAGHIYVYIRIYDQQHV